MQTLNIEITNQDALQVLKDLQAKDFIKIRANYNLSSSIFPGEPFSLEEFKNFIFERENGKSISLIQAKTKWAKKKKQLLKSIK